MKHLSIIIILILVILGGLVFSGFTDGGDTLTPEQRHAPPYLIDNMELARDTHQDIVDDLERNKAWLKGGVDHQVWVDIYDEIIEVLEVIK